MRSNHRIFLIRILFAFLIVVPCQAYAWEFSLDGSYFVTFEYYSQIGSKGFFGPYDSDAQFGGSAASLNGYIGQFRVAAPIVSGTDASTHWQEMNINTTVRINKAVRWRGLYHLGAYGDPVDSEYRIGSGGGVFTAASDGQWTMWWVTAKTPIGTINLGKRPKAFGLGLISNGNGGSSVAESVSLTANYGPLRIGNYFYPSRRASEGYYNEDDKSNIRIMDFGHYLTYRSGTLDIGIEYAWDRRHRGAEGEIPAAQAARTTITRDRANNRIDAYLKFSNGRVFFNAELGWNDNYVTYQSNPAVADITDGRGSQYAPDYVESWRYMVEGGVRLGPGKMSLLYAYLPGPDRRQGVLVDKQPFFDTNSGYGVFRPYCFLLGYAFGSGINAFDQDNQGYINDAMVVAGRVDYSAAANLNLYSTFLWAQRAGSGYGYGFIDLDPAAPNSADLVLFNTNAGDPRGSNAISINAPNIPVRDLGWEATAGIDWEILNGYLVRSLFAYWQPGDWFKYACIDKSVANRGAPNWGINPDRIIDPIIAGAVNVEVAF